MKTSFLAFILLINSMLFTFAGNEVWIPYYQTYLSFRLIQ